MAATDALGEIVDGIAAIINKKVITQSQVEQVQQQFLRQGMFTLGDSDETRREKVLNFLVENELVRQRAEEKGIFVGSDEVDTALSDIKKRNNIVSDDQLKSAINQEGQTWDEFLEEIRRQIKVAKLMNQEVRSQIEMTEEEIQAYYQTHPNEFEQTPPNVHIRHILLKVDENASEKDIEERRKLAHDLVQQLREGADFETLAQQYSDHPSAANGGELGTFKEGQLASPFDIAFTMNAGEISDPVRSDTGFHIIYVQEKIGGAQASYQNAQQIIQRKLFEEKSQERYQEWITELKAHAYIEIR